jgi:hypothetical protein
MSAPAPPRRGGGGGGEGGGGRRRQVELHATTLKYNTMKKDSRPPNTRDAYEPRQREWRQWCGRKRFADGELVTEGKMVAFLDQEVVGRRVRTQPRRDAPRR